MRKEERSEDCKNRRLYDRKERKEGFEENNAGAGRVEGSGRRKERGI